MFVDIYFVVASLRSVAAHGHISTGSYNVAFDLRLHGELMSFGLFGGALLSISI